jgi:hypothetical protein
MVTIPRFVDSFCSPFPVAKLTYLMMTVIIIDVVDLIGSRTRAVAGIVHLLWDRTSAAMAAPLPIHESEPEHLICDPRGCGRQPLSTEVKRT